jgi:hypothetical protein
MHRNTQPHSRRISPPPQPKLHPPERLTSALPYPVKQSRRRAGDRPPRSTSTRSQDAATSHRSCSAPPLMPPSATRQKSGRLTFKLDSTDICTLGLHGKSRATRDSAPRDYGRASRIMLNAVSVARLTWRKPPAVMTSRNLVSPACAPSAAPTSCDSDVGTQPMVEPA